MNFIPLYQSEHNVRVTNNFSGKLKKFLLVSLLVVFALVMMFGMKSENSISNESEKITLAFIPDSFDIRYTAEGQQCDWAAREEYACVAGNWAFTLTQGLRNTKCYKGTQLDQLSAQQLIDCTSYGSNTCAEFTNLSNLNNAFQFMSAYGVGLAATYSYKKLSASPGDCYLPSVDYFANITQVTNNNDLMTSIINNGPAILVLNYYSSLTRNNIANQIYTHSNPDFQLGYRTLLIVGWGTESSTSKKYWIAANTFGKLWGNNGYTNIYQDDSYINSTYVIN